VRGGLEAAAPARPAAQGGPRSRRAGLGERGDLGAASGAQEGE
jgi:hypothetical protein